MTTIHIVGKPRKGKGVLTTWLTLPVADAGKPVDSNYHMDSPNVNCIGFYDLLYFLKKPRQEPTHLLCIDELPGWCDSYVTSSKSSRFATHFVNQSAKLGYDLIFTSQRSKRADINFRENVDYRFMSDKICACNLPKCPSDCIGLSTCHFKYQPLDIENDEEDIPIGKPFKLSFELAKSVWGRFDTFEAVPPVGLDEVLSEMQKYDPVRHNEAVDKQVKLLQEVWKPYWLLDQRTVKDVLLEYHQSLNDVDVVFSRLRRKQRQPQQQKIETNQYPPQNMEQNFQGNRIGWLVAPQKLSASN